MTLREAIGRQGSMTRTFKAVAWSFFGVRRGSEYEKDVNQLNPLHVVVAGVVAAALFVGGIVLVVNWVVDSGVAG